MTRTPWLVSALALFTGACASPSTNDDKSPTTTLCKDNVCTLSGVIDKDLTLTADKTWLLRGGVFVGDDADPTRAPTTLTIEPGTKIYGETSVLSFLLITRGSRILANGTAAAPIVFTSAKAEGTRGRGDWGGLVLNGRAPVNGCTGNPCVLQGEAGTGTYGGNDPHDDSGVLRFVRLEFTGALIDAENEFNGVAFQGVGDGTTVENIQVHRTADDCIEFFGGTVNAKRILCTGAGDDNLDWTFGWTGHLQFLVAQQHPDAGERGIEADNNEANHALTPVSDPVVSHVTLIGQNKESKNGILLRRGTHANIHNAVVFGWTSNCFDIDDDATFAAAQAGEVTLSSSILACDKPTNDAVNDPIVLSTFVNTTNTGNISSDPLLVDPLNLTAPDFRPRATSPALTGGVKPAGAFFEEATFRGGIGPDDNWLAGWTAFPVN